MGELYDQRFTINVTLYFGIKEFPPHTLISYMFRTSVTFRIEWRRIITSKSLLAEITML
jgi:hypothetical protein